MPVFLSHRTRTPAGDGSISITPQPRPNSKHFFRPAAALSAEQFVDILVNIMHKYSFNFLYGSMNMRISTVYLNIFVTYHIGIPGFSIVILYENTVDTE